jgi:hypothetical protein
LLNLSELGRDAGISHTTAHAFLFGMHPASARSTSSSSRHQRSARSK